MWVKRLALLERTAHKPSTFKLSGFSHSLLSQIESRVFSLLLEVLHLLIGSLPQVMLNDLRLPFGRMQQVTQALRSRRGLVRAQQIPAQLA